VRKMRAPLVNLLSRCFEKVQNHMGWTERKTLLWFDTPNPLLGPGMSPGDLLVMRPDKIERWIDQLIEENKM